MIIIITPTTIEIVAGGELYSIMRSDCATFKRVIYDFVLFAEFALPKQNY